MFVCCVCVCGSIDRPQAPLMQHSGKETDTGALKSQCSSMAFIGIFFRPGAEGAHLSTVMAALKVVLLCWESLHKKKT